jgi:hypothetical protein
VIDDCMLHVTTYCLVSLFANGDTCSMLYYEFMTTYFSKFLWSKHLALFGQWYPRVLALCQVVQLRSDTNFALISCLY